MGNYRIGQIVYHDSIARGVLAMIQNAVLNLMMEQGGTFNRRLVELYLVADSENSKKLEQAFIDIFGHFQKLSDEASTNQN